VAGLLAALYGEKKPLVEPAVGKGDLLLFFEHRAW
jgi:hypothetical protein